MAIALPASASLPAHSTPMGRATAVPPAIPYQGSKRKLAAAILACFPEELPALHEPFCGSAAVSLAAGRRWPAVTIHLNDANQALAGLWQEIVARPHELAARYRQLWQDQQGRERPFYDEVRDTFNATGEPHLLLFLLARCVKAAVRYNGRGEFNQSPDNRRLGTRPRRMAANLLTASAILGQRTTVTSIDFATALAAAGPDDVVYLDPPYQGVSTAGDRRYAGRLDGGQFVAALEDLNGRGISYVLSYDGRTGTKVHGRPLPGRLGLAHFDVDAGVSSQATLSGRRRHTVESLYLSPALLDRLSGPPAHLRPAPPAAVTV